MSKGRRDLTGDEQALWRRVASKVKPRRGGSLDVAPLVMPLASRKSSEQAGVQRRGAAQETSHPPPNRAGEKRIRRGDIEVGATLDLHGFSQDAALAALTRFLHRAQRRGDRAVIVVTGVGRGGEGVLRRMFPAWLASKEIRPLISGYAQAHRNHGGSGAFYVFIKRQRA